MLRTVTIKPWMYFLFISVVIYLVTNKIGSSYVGIDNLSPFWGVQPILAQISHAGNYFSFGPLLFSWWFYLLSFVGVSAEILSQAYVYGYLFLALIGYHTLTEKILKTPVHWAVFSLIFFSSLIPLWIFSTHEMMFMSLFTALPFIFIWLLQPSSFKNTLFQLLFIFPLFFTSSVNVVVFAFGYLFLGLLLLLTKNLNSVSLIKIALLGGIFLLASQILILYTNGSIPIQNEFTNHLVTLNNSTEMLRITSDLQKSELQNASITNAMRFATGWLALFDVNQSYLLPWATTFRNNLVVIVAQLSIIFAAILLPFLKKGSDTKIWSILYVTGAFLLSIFGLTLIVKIPYVGLLLRSASTKLWMLIFLPYIILTARLLLSYANLPWRIVLFILLLIPSFPWLIGQFSGSFNSVIIPKEYTQYYASLSAKDVVLTLPEPQAIYFRKYDWGYYGSSLTSYMTTARILDGGTITSAKDEYKAHLARLLLCKNPSKIVVVEASPSIEQYQNCLRSKYVVTQYQNFAVYTLKSNE